jgi:hypothetical protein
LEGALVGGPDVGTAGEGHHGIGDADDTGFLVVEFEDIAEFDGAAFVGSEAFAAEVVDDDGVGEAKVFEAALAGLEFGRSAGEGGGVDADELDDFEVAIGEADALDAGVDGGGPGDAVDGADAGDVGVEEGVGFIDLFNLFFDDPDGSGDVFEGGGGPTHEAAEDGGLLRHEERGEDETRDEHEILAGISEEHFESEAQHLRKGTKLGNQ